MVAVGNKLIEVNNLKKYFKTKRGMLHAVDDLSFHIDKGETLGLVGESGCGKSTTGRVLIRLLEATAGQVLMDGEDVLSASGKRLANLRTKMQMVFQDPYSCLNPRMTVSELISEPLEVNNRYTGKTERPARIRELMDIVGLATRLTNAYPHELDGGRRQRVGIARALALNPEFIVQDEPVSALDVCIQAQILNLMKNLQKELGLTYLFISHDLSVVKHVSDRIAVMYLGSMVELTDYRSIFKNPLHPYTQALLSAIPIAKVDVDRDRILLEGDVPSPIEPPAGCRFAGRCRFRQERCTVETPELRQMEPGRWVACHYAGQLEERRA
ncbi:oligopeptide/dipeptide ABC transporter, ATPase subunit [Dethiosulfovibrio peptidovorans DSM 11002]|jgi:peptide/nickel transport system ATP-binding protein|uniref:Oligopeptide/dipeptide ABC transporter, ATPase subunit n=1 Tax=Dethiosulfovibrio peptidovorans DSM 11002 TaxID=469381 RepID=D2Z5U9_9BACT|nr:oligopeptide/dipeptide ABC transporter ATP-binding protein [Dethiosulfovibrio peptidovorans]EFC90846.1 oligopeptide/dipeptide ABC transporter, ATPase subunit [Dethiosulfovibrio peptidovorans DSM 11002]